MMNKKNAPIHVEAGKTYSLCTCDRSAIFPLCDGNHKGTGLRSLRYEAGETALIVFKDGRIEKVDA